MDIGDPGPGFVRVLLEAPQERVLADAAKLLLASRSPVDILSPWARKKRSSQLIIDPSFGAVPIPGGGHAKDISASDFDPDAYARFIIRAFVKADSNKGVPESIDGEPVHSDPAVGSNLVTPSSRAVGDTTDVQVKLDTDTLAQYGLDGSGVAIAIVDTGIFLPRLTKRLGAQPTLDTANSWSPLSVVTQAGSHRIGHGTMCAYDALIAAPKATLLDIAMLIARGSADHTATGTVSAAIQALAIDL